MQRKDWCSGVQVLDERHWMVARSHEVDGGVRRRPREIRVVEGCV